MEMQCPRCGAAQNVMDRALCDACKELYIVCKQLTAPGANGTRWTDGFFWVPGGDVLMHHWLLPPAHV